MNIFFFLIQNIFLVLVAFNLFSADNCNLTPSAQHFYVEVKPGVFFYEDRNFRDILGHDSFMFTVEIDGRINNYVSVFFETGYLHDSGKIKPFDIKTTLSLYPNTLGIKAVGNVYSFLSIYAKIGPNLIKAKEKTHTPCNICVKKNAFGYTLGAGLYFLIKNIALDLFVNYYSDRKTYTDSYSRIKFTRQFGGCQCGAGLGIKF